VQIWLNRFGGAIIIIFGLFMLGLITPAFLSREHKFNLSKMNSSYFTSFIFGVAFAVGWTPCVSAALGAILGLAVTQTTNAFILLLTYSLGLGLPFIILGFFIEKSRSILSKSGKWLNYFQKFFGAILIIIGILVFTNQLSAIANVGFIVGFLDKLNIGFGGAGISSLSFISLIISFFAGLSSFLSPCVLPLLPSFLSYLASETVKDK
jgi:cytochrome c-type biogenesis protein